MKFKFTIARRLGFGFGILTIAVLLSSIAIYITLNKNREISHKIISIYTPSVSELNNMYVELNNTKMLIKNWVIDAQADTPNKLKLKEFHATGFKTYKDTLLTLSERWPENDQKTLEDLITAIEDTLFEKHKHIMEQLSDFESYNDLGVLWAMQPLVEEDGEVMILTDNILAELDTLLEDIEQLAEKGNTEMVDSFNNFQNFIVFIGIVLFLGALLIALFTIRSIVRPINRLKQVLMKMSRGVLPEKTMKVNNDEIGEMTIALNLFINSLRETSEFAQEIGKGNFDSEFKPLSEEDTLGNSLINMRGNLIEANKLEAQRKKEDEQRNWVTRGLAKFGDILRMNNDDLEELSYNIISNLVKYIGANQGGMFILNDDYKDDPYLELYSAYAYDRKKFVQKEIRQGEGLVGTCLLEKQTIYMVDVPDSYVNITSGLGKANPRSILIVPLKLNEAIYGVIELASFKHFEKYQIEFVEKVGESIASTISNVKINSRTAKLLQESKEQSEQLIQQEEEMRQNLEELQSTQEESDRRVEELQNSLDMISSVVASFEMDLSGNIINANEHFMKVLALPYDNIIGKQHQMLVSPDHFDYTAYQELLDELGHGFKKTVENVYLTPKGELWLNETYLPVKNHLGEYEKVIIAAFDVTHYKTQESRAAVPVEK